MASLSSGQTGSLHIETAAKHAVARAATKRRCWLYVVVVVGGCRFGGGGCNRRCRVKEEGKGIHLRSQSSSFYAVCGPLLGNWKIVFNGCVRWRWDWGGGRLGRTFKRADIQEHRPAPTKPSQTLAIPPNTSPKLPISCSKVLSEGTRLSIWD